MLKAVLMIGILFGPAVHAQVRTNRGMNEYHEWVQRMQLRQMQEGARARPELEEQRRQAAEQAIEAFYFTKNFNKLVESLSSFADEYNAGTVDVKTVNAVKDAWAKIEKHNSWFRNARNRLEKDRCTPSASND